MHDWMNKLERAKALLDAGALSQDEFEAEKARLLPKRPIGLPTNDEQPPQECDEAPASSSGIWRKISLAASVIIAVVAACLFILDQSPTVLPQSDVEASLPPNPDEGSDEVSVARPTMRSTESINGNVDSSAEPYNMISDCSGFYAYLDISNDYPTGLSVEVSESSVNVRFSDYGSVSGRKQSLENNSIQFSEGPGEPVWKLTCHPVGATLTIPASQWNEERVYSLEKSDEDIFGYAFSKGYDLRH